MMSNQFIISQMSNVPSFSGIFHRWDQFLAFLSNRFRVVFINKNVCAFTGISLSPVQQACLYI